MAVRSIRRVTCELFYFFHRRKQLKERKKYIHGTDKQVWLGKLQRRGDCDL